MVLHSVQTVLFFSRGKRSPMLPPNYPSLLRWIAHHQQQKYLVIISPKYASCTRLLGIMLLAKQIKPKLRLPTTFLTCTKRRRNQHPKGETDILYRWILKAVVKITENNTLLEDSPNFYSKSVYSAASRKRSDFNGQNLCLITLINCDTEYCKDKIFFGWTVHRQVWCCFIFPADYINSFY